MTTDLLMAIRALEGIEINNLFYSSVYLFASENIRGFTRKLSFEDNNVLTVCSSGDQALNLILNGADTIDLFDINIFTKYYFYLKKAAIETLDYNQFLNFFFPKFFNDKVFCFDTYLEIRKNISDDEIRYFWDYLFCHYSGSSIYNSELFRDLYYPKDTIVKANDYLMNEQNYNKLKLLLENLKFNFYHLNIFEDKIPNDIRYDFIYLSNIFDYLNIDNKLEYTNKVKEIILNTKNNITDTGLIAVSYLYLYRDDIWFDCNRGRLKSELFRKKYFNDCFEYIQFPGFYAPNDGQIRNKDALMLYRKK